MKKSLIDLFDSRSDFVLKPRRFSGRAGLLHLPEHHASTAPAGGAWAGDPAGPKDDRQGAQRFHPGVGVACQADGAGREADRPGRWETSSSFHWPLACFVFVEKFENILLDVVSSNPLAKCCIGNMLQPSTHPPGGGGDVLRPDLSTHEKLKTFQSHVPLC